MKPSLAPISSWMTTYSVLCLSVLLSVFASGRCMMLQTSGAEEYSSEMSNEVPIPGSPRVFHDNGMLYLILHELSLEFIRDLLEVEQIPLTEMQQRQVENRIKGFYRQIIDHPALSSDRVIFAPNHPDFQHLIPPKTSAELSNPSDRVGKRSGALEIEVCPSHSSWAQYRSGSTRDGTVIPLIGEQFFWITECTGRSGCRHVSSGFRSRCIQKTSWVMASLVDPTADSGKRWDWISIPTCCSCALSRVSG